MEALILVACLAVLAVVAVRDLRLFGRAVGMAAIGLVIAIACGAAIALVLPIGR